MQMVRLARFVAVICLVLLCQVAHADPQIGQPAPALAGKMLDGTEFDLAAMKGKVVLVHFWATWCPSCREEMPVLDKFYRENHAKGLEAIAVSVDRRGARDEVLKYMKDFAFPAAIHTELSSDDFGSAPIIPLTYVVDSKGIVQSEMDPSKAELTEQELSKVVSPLLRSIGK
jgi:cytochrome c biogenesis protein CcmG, thiol:disulfide interchange protein DsbE